MKQYGFWESEFSIKDLTKNARTLQEIGVRGNQVFWTEARPEENGRNALVSSFPSGSLQEEASSRNVKTRVHGYGGGAFKVFADRVVFFDDITKGLYSKNNKGKVECLIKDSSKCFADFTLSPDGTAVVCVCEEKKEKGDPDNYLVSIDCGSKKITVLDSSFSFYASPQFSPDGKKLGFLSWGLALMSWEECHLTVLSFEKKDRVEIKNKLDSICQYIWVSSEEIIFVSDRNGFWNLYITDLEEERLLYAKEADFAYPLWVLGRKNFSLCIFQGKRALLCFFTEKAIDAIGVLLIDEGKLIDLKIPFTVVRALDVEGEGPAYFIGGSSTAPLSLVRLDLNTVECTTVRESFSLEKRLLSQISLPIPVSARSSVDHEEVFGFYYPPKNGRYAEQKETNAPLIVKCHSGPTSHSSPLLSFQVQFWTSRGFGFLDVNYRGSTGFGRDYRRALNKNWGFLDVRDVRDLALVFAKNGQVFARGSSSGGLTALGLARTGLLTGCVSAYGVTDLKDLALKTHKFEKCYMDSLVGEERHYEERSPLSHPEKIDCPVLFLHGEDDPVVPLSQAEDLCKAINRGILSVFPGEGHGFRQEKTVQKSLELELAFYLGELSSSRM